MDAALLAQIRTREAAIETETLGPSPAISAPRSTIRAPNPDDITPIRFLWQTRTPPGFSYPKAAQISDLSFEFEMGEVSAHNPRNYTHTQNEAREPA